MHVIVVHRDLGLSYLPQELITFSLLNDTAFLSLTMPLVFKSALSDIGGVS